MSSEGAVLRGDLKAQVSRLVADIAEVRETVRNLYPIDRLDTLIELHRVVALAAREAGRGWLRKGDALPYAVLLGAVVWMFAADADSEADDDPLRCAINDRAGFRQVTEFHRGHGCILDPELS